VILLVVELCPFFTASVALSVQGGGADVRVWFLTLHAGDEYPRVAPTAKFTSKIVMDCVDGSGNVSLSPSQQALAFPDPPY
jgi:hypothetical protein